MALNGRAGQRFSQAPQPIQRSTFTIGTFNESGLAASEGTIVIAPTGQCRAQLPHATPSRNGTQFFSTHTAWPICVADSSAGVSFSIAPAGHTSEHFVHSGRQYPLSYDISGCINVSSLVEGRNTSFGQTETQSWQAVQCVRILRNPRAPGGTSGVVRSGTFLSRITAKPPSTFFSCALRAEETRTSHIPVKKLRRALSVFFISEALSFTPVFPNRYL